MPTNLPPEYKEAERRYREAESTAERVACLEEMLSTIPKHKGTDKLRADYRRRLSKMKAELQAARKSAGKRISEFRVEREGAGQAVIIGHANVGKSALVRALTNATPEVAETPYTTWRPTPGMMEFEYVQIQLVDTPPLNRDFVEPELLDLIRRADLILLVVDLQADPFEQLEKSVNLLLEHRIIPRNLKERYEDGQRMTLVPLYVLANKCDDVDADEDCQVFGELLEQEWPLLPVSAVTGRNLERLKRIVFEHMDVIRVYSKAPGQEPDYSKPFVMKVGGTIEELAGKIHHDFIDNLKMARVWGSGAFDGQLVPRDYVLQDGDVVELRI